MPQGKVAAAISDRGLEARGREITGKGHLRAQQQATGKQLRQHLSCAPGFYWGMRLGFGGCGLQLLASRARAARQR